MEICPKGVFISIWLLPVQIKVQKENIRTKRETSEAYSEPYKTSKMKLFTKILNGFHLLFSLLSKMYSELNRASKIGFSAKNGYQLLLPLLPKLFYTHAYSEPS